MEKEELRKIAETYGMEILRDPLTNKAWGVMLETKEDIPELDALLEGTGAGGGFVIATKEYGVYEAVSGTHLYKVTAPTKWFDLAGWAE